MDIKSTAISLLVLVIGWLLKDLYEYFKNKSKEPIRRDKELEKKLTESEERWKIEIEALEADNELMKDALLCQHRDRLIDLCEIAIERCEITEVHYERLEKMYHSYKALGGNHSVDKLWAHVEELQIVKYYSK